MLFIHPLVYEEIKEAIEKSTPGLPKNVRCFLFYSLLFFAIRKNKNPNIVHSTLCLRHTFHFAVLLYTHTLALF